MNENFGSSSVLIILTLEILESAPNDPKLNSNDLTWKVPYRWSFLDRDQIFIRFALRSTVLDIAHFMIFPVTPMLKFQSATFFFNLGDCQEQ